MTHPLLTRQQVRRLSARRDRLRADATGKVLEVEIGMDVAAFPDHPFDTIVVAMVMCSVPDPDVMTMALRQSLAPGGRLLFLEHVASIGARAALQRVTSPLWSVVADGCRPDRDAVNTFRQAGFAVTDCDRFRLPGPNPLLTSWAQGVARPRPLIPEGPVGGGREEEEVIR